MRLQIFLCLRETGDCQSNKMVFVAHCCEQALSVGIRDTTRQVYCWQVAVGYLELFCFHHMIWRYCQYLSQCHIVMFGFHSPKMAWWSVPKKAGLNWNRFELCGWRVVLGTLILHAMTHSRIRDRTSLRAAKNGDTHTHAWQHASRDVSKVISDKPDSQLAAPRLVSTFRQHATRPYIYIYMWFGAQKAGFPRIPNSQSLAHCLGVASGLFCPVSCLEGYAAAEVVHGGWIITPLKTVEP